MMQHTIANPANPARPRLRAAKIAETTDSSANSNAGSFSLPALARMQALSGEVLLQFEAPHACFCIPYEEGSREISSFRFSSDASSKLTYGFTFLRDIPIFASAVICHLTAALPFELYPA